MDRVREVLGLQGENGQADMEVMQNIIEMLTEQLRIMREQQNAIQVVPEIQNRNVVANQQLIENIDALDDKQRQPTIEECRAYIENRAVGKLVDDTYMVWMGSIGREYITRRARIPLIEQNFIIQNAMQLHLWQIHPRYQYNMDALAAFNDNIAFVKRCELRFRNYVCEIPGMTVRLRDRAGNALGQASTVVRCRPLWTALGLFGATIITSAALLASGRLLCRVISSFTTHNLMRVSSAVFRTVTFPYRLANMIPTSSGTHDILSSLKLNVDNGLMMNTSSTLTTRASASFIKSMQMACNLVKKYDPTSALLQSWRSCPLTNIRHLASYKPDIQPLILHTAALLNQSKEPISIVTSSVRELMTRLPPRLIDYLKNTNTIMNATTHHLTHTLLPICSNYATDTIWPATKTTANYMASISAHYGIQLLHGMETTIPLVGHACLETSTQAMEIASSIITSYGPSCQTLISKAMRSSMEMTVSSSQTAWWITTDFVWPLARTTWNLCSVAAMKLASIRWNSVEPRWYDIHLGIIAR